MAAKKAAPRRKAQRRATKRSVTVWIARDNVDHEIFATAPRWTNDGYGRFRTTPEGEEWERGELLSICNGQTRKLLGLRLKVGEMIPMTITFGRFKRG